MQIIFRVDASQRAGTGHVMRCLTLATFLQEKGADVVFMSRTHAGNLIDFVQQAGFKVFKLPVLEEVSPAIEANNYTTWLGSSWQQDVDACTRAFAKIDLSPDWLIVDHYALDANWHKAMRHIAPKIMVIDDLGNRPLDCDILLDQNFAHPAHERYPAITLPNTKMLLGPEYALIRQEFAKMRESALGRRDGKIKRLLISLGGADSGNDTQKILNAFGKTSQTDLDIDVVVGSSNPHQASLKKFCDQFQYMRLHVQTSHMARLMTDADCAFTAGGSTTWERCVLGLPAIVTIQAENQRDIAMKLAAHEAQVLLGVSDDLTSEDYATALDKLSPDELMQMSKRSASICDGLGVMRVADHLYEEA